MSADLTELIAKARAAYDAMTPTQRRAMDLEQRRSYCRAEAGFGSDRDEAEYAAAMASGDTTRIAACEAKSQARMAVFDQYWEQKYG